MPTLGHALPQLFVTDFARALAFYRDVLGFDVVYTYGEPPFYGMVQCGQAQLNLRHVDASPWRGEVRTHDDLLAAGIPVDDIAALYGEMQEREVPIHQPLTTQPWGLRDFIVADPDGNRIGFHGASPTEADA